MTVRRWLGASVLAVGLAGLAAGTAGAGIDTSPTVPIKGKAVMVTVTDDLGTPVRGASVEAVFRPGSKVIHTMSLGKTGPGGTLQWSPQNAGLVTLNAMTPDSVSYSRNLSVRFTGLPVSGLVILLAAGVILYGGVIRGFRSLGTPPPKLPPDT